MFISVQSQCPYCAQRQNNNDFFFKLPVQLPQEALNLSDQPLFLRKFRSGDLFKFPVQLSQEALTLSDQPLFLRKFRGSDFFSSCLVSPMTHLPSVCPATLTYTPAIQQQSPLLGDVRQILSEGRDAVRSSSLVAATPAPLQGRLPVHDQSAETLQTTPGYTNIYSSDPWRGVVGMTIFEGLYPIFLDRFICTQCSSCVQTQISVIMHNKEGNIESNKF